MSTEPTNKHVDLEYDITLPQDPSVEDNIGLGLMTPKVTTVVMRR